MAIEKVREYFRQFGIDTRIQEFKTSSATVELAARALGCKPERIAKTLSFKVDQSAVLIVAAGDAKIDNAKFKAQFHTKAKMLAPDEVAQMVGHAIGGVCPFAVNPGVDVYLDLSLKRFETVFPACGSSNSAIELTIPELARYAGSNRWIDVCKDCRLNACGNLQRIKSRREHFPSAFYYAGKPALKYHFIYPTAALQSENTQAAK